jgi:hypothetical protein
MNRDLTDLPGAGEQRDPVAEFFAHERAEVRDLPPARAHWDDIVREGTRPARRSWLPYAGAAAAAVVVGAVAWGGVAGLGDDANPATASREPATGATVTSTVTVTAPVLPSPSPSTAASSTPSGPLPVPASFSLVSMSNAGNGHLFALGSAKCANGDCVQVVASDDDGRTWERRSAFIDLTTPGARTTPDRAHQVVGIRFATPEIGYLYGSTTKRTTDGGRTWSDVDVDRRVVLSLETDGKRVWMATARSCEHSKAPPSRGCSDLQPRTGDVGSTTTTAVLYSGMSGDGENAWISMDGSDAYYNVTGPSPDVVVPFVPARVSGKPAMLPVPNGCADGAAVSGTANARGTLVAVCRSEVAPEKQYTLAVSTDRGRTWTAKPSPGLGTPSDSGIWLSAVDAKRLVAVRQGLPASSGQEPAATQLLVSADGGASWRDAKLSKAGTTAWAGAAGGGLVYAFDGGQSYWQSNDAGAHFETVPMRR